MFDLGNLSPVASREGLFRGCRRGCVVLSDRKSPVSAPALAGLCPQQNPHSFRCSDCIPGSGSPLAPAGWGGGATVMGDPGFLSGLPARDHGIWAPLTQSSALCSGPKIGAQSQTLSPQNPPWCISDPLGSSQDTKTTAVFE